MYTSTIQKNITCRKRRATANKDIERLRKSEEAPVQIRHCLGTNDERFETRDAYSRKCIIPRYVPPAMTNGEGTDAYHEPFLIFRPRWASVQPKTWYGIYTGVFLLVLTPSAIWGVDQNDRAEESKAQLRDKIRYVCFENGEENFFWCISHFESTKDLLRNACVRFIEKCCLF